jgi:hypothetical protein
MRLLCIGLSAASVLMLIPFGTQAGTRIVPTHPERDKLSETRKRELVLGDLESILAGPASSTTVTTQPYASSEEGLCQRDVIQLKYAAKGDDRPNRPVVPIGVRAVLVQYHFLDWADNRSWASWQKACAKLSGQKIYWAFGDDDHYAASALGALKSTVADVRKGQRYTISCGELDRPKSGTSCVDIFLSAAEQISAISKPARDIGDVYAFTSTPYEFTIVITYPQHLNGDYSTAIEIRHQEIVAI